MLFNRCEQSSWAQSNKKAYGHDSSSKLLILLFHKAIAFHYTLLRYRPTVAETNPYSLHINAHVQQYSMTIRTLGIDMTLWAVTFCTEERTGWVCQMYIRLAPQASVHVRTSYLLPSLVAGYCFTVVCLSVCKQDDVKCYGWICMKLGGLGKL